MRIGDRFVLYYVAMTKIQHYCAVGHACSDDLMHWEDRGPIIAFPTTFRGTGMVESPCVVQGDDGRWWLFYRFNAATWYAISDSPYRFRNPVERSPIRVA